MLKEHPGGSFGDVINRLIDAYDGGDAEWRAFPTTKLLPLSPSVEVTDSYAGETLHKSRRLS